MTTTRTRATIPLPAPAEEIVTAIIAIETATIENATPGKTGDGNEATAGAARVVKVRLAETGIITTTLGTGTGTVTETETVIGTGNDRRLGAGKM